MNQRILFSILVLCSVTSHHLAIADSVSTDSFSDLPIVLSNNVLAKNPTKTPLTLSIIDKKMIESSGARTIPDALRLIPGIVVGHSVNEFGDKPLIVVSYHGHSDQFSKRMNVLIDGRSIYDPLLGGVNWYNIPIALDDIEHIEVTHGPNASTYGSNSFQAVINIITRHASEDKGHMVKAKLGNHAIFDTTYRYADSRKDLDYRITLSTVNDDGQDRKGGGDAYDDVGAGRVDYRLDYQYDNNNKLTYTGAYGETEQNTEATLRPNTIPQLPQRTITDITAHQLVRWDSTISEKQSIVLKYYYNYLDEADAFDAAPIDLSLINPAYSIFQPLILSLDKSFTSERQQLELNHFYSADNNIEYVWGVSVQDDHVSSDYYLNPTGVKHRNTYRIFGEAAWQIDRSSSFDVGVLVEKSTQIKTNVSPRVTYLYQINQDHSLRAGFSQAVRTPFIIEQFGETFQTEQLYLVSDGSYAGDIKDYFNKSVNQLTPEKISSIELGYRGNLLQDRLKVNARIFQDKLKDLIHAPFTAIVVPAGDDVDGMAFVFDNLFATITRGIELEFDFRLNDSTRFIVNSSFIDITSDDNSIGGESEQLTESAPKQSYSFLAMHDFKNAYSASLGFYYIGDMSFTDVNNANPTGLINTGIIRKLDLRVARDFSVGSETLSAAVVLQNLLGEYSDYDAIPNSPDPIVVQNLNAFIELKMKFR